MKLHKLGMALAAVKVMYLLSVLGALLLWSGMDVSELRQAMQRGPEDGKPRIFATWDASWYLHLSKVGYSRGDYACAFYPLWPISVRWFSQLTGGNLIMAGMLLANLCSLFGFLLFFDLVRRRFGERTAVTSLMLLCTFPGSLFFQFIYSEGMFFLLVMLLCWALEKNWFWVALIAAFLLPLTKAIGVFCFFPMLIHIARQRPPFWLLTKLAAKSPFLRHEFSTLQDQWKPEHRTNDQLKARCGPQPYWVLLAPIYGWLCYLLLMFFWTGNAFEGFDAQQHWGVQSVANLFNFPKFVIGFLSPLNWHGFKGSFLDRCAFVPVLCCLPILWRLDKVWFVWMLVLGIVPALTGTFSSYTRFASVAFPLFLGLGAFLTRGERHALRLGLLGLFSTLHWILLWRFVNFKWAG